MSGLTEPLPPTRTILLHVYSVIDSTGYRQILCIRIPANFASESNLLGFPDKNRQNVLVCYIEIGVGEGSEQPDIEVD